MSPIASVRDWSSVFLLALYMVLGYGFMVVRLSAAVPLPIGELVLIGSLLTIRHDTAWPRFEKTLPIASLLLWWGLGFVLIVVGYAQFGAFALRDATPIIESLFIYVGFVFAGSGGVERLARCLPMILILASIHSLLAPFASFLTIGPVLQGASGQPVPLFLTFSNSGLILVLALGYLLIVRESRWRFVYMIVAAFLAGLAVFIYQGRTVYFQLIALLALFVLCRRRRLATRLSVAFGIAVMAVVLFAAIGISVSGRLGQTASLGLLGRHLLSTFGIAGSGVEGAADGVFLRLDWWSTLFRDVTSSPWTSLFGLGYGRPLTNFVNSAGVVVREPHNSFISMWARSGFIGLFLFLAVHWSLVSAWFRARRHSISKGDNQAESLLLMFMVYFVLVWLTMLGEDGLEKPYLAIPYYLFWGIVLRQSRRPAPKKPVVIAPPHSVGEGKCG